MKKIRLIIMALALISGLTQCKKDNAVLNTIDQDRIDITINVDNGSKINVNTETGIVKFERYDALHIVSDGKYCGFVTMDKDGGPFVGTIKAPAEGQPMYIYFFGVHNKHYYTIETGATKCSIDISDQTGKLPVISCGMTDVYSPVTTSYDVRLLNKCALVKFNVLTSAETEATCLKGLNNEMIIDFEAHTFTPDTVKDAVIKLKPGSGERWAILLPNSAESEGGVAYSEDYRYIGSRSAVGVINNNDFITTGYTVKVETATGNNPTYDDMKFSLSPTKRVEFAKGNVQHVIINEEWVWKFADHQYDVLTNENIQKYEGPCDRDRFGWGTGDNPDLMSHSNSNYPQNTTEYIDWGVNFSSNEGRGAWHAPKCVEWKYLMFQRPATELNGVYNARYARARVNSVNGIILFPDVYHHPTDVEVPLPKPASINYTTDKDGSYTVNTYTTVQWEAMEAAGAVFLPLTSKRDYQGGAWGFYDDVPTGEGRYWSQCDLGDANNACNLYFTDYRAYVKDKNDKFKGFAVRLVRE